MTHKLTQDDDDDDDDDDADDDDDGDDDDDDDDDNHDLKPHRLRQVLSSLGDDDGDPHVTQS